MKTVMYYFSGTGNSLALARDLAAQLGDARVIPIAGTLISGWDEQADTVGIVFPVYMFGLPLIVADFLKALKVKPGAYIFTAATMGRLPGRAHTQARTILKRRGIILSAGFSVCMPGNYTPLYEAIAQDRQERLFRGQKERVKEIARIIEQRKSAVMEEKPLWINSLLCALLYKVGIAQIPAAGKDFRVTAACNECGLCEKICPVANIHLRDGKPVWLRHCQQCMACLQWCPQEAIQYKQSTQGRKRYRHPEVTAQMIMEQR